jgi:hypothetical protein
MFARLRSLYAPPAARGETSISAEDRAWGLMPTARYAAVLERTLARDWIPRFARHGIDARAAWQGPAAPA